MKKILLLTTIALTGSMAIAQDNSEKEIKNVRFGLIVTPAVNWLKPDDGKIISANGAVVKFGGGLSIEFRLAKVASIVTGIEINTMGGKVKYANGGSAAANTNTVSYYASKSDDGVDDYLTRPDEATNYNDAKYYDQTHYKFQLNEREYKATYINIPFGIKLKTKEIGMMTYFGQVGINNNIRWKAKATDKVIELPTLDNLTGGASSTRSNVSATKEMNVYMGSLHLGAGCEMNLSGSTSLLIGVHYNLGFTSITKSESPTLEKKTNGPNYSQTNMTDYTISKMPQAIKANGVVLTVGILF